MTGPREILQDMGVTQDAFDLAKDDDAMLIARKMMEEHIECYGMVPHPDRIKERIAGAVRIAFGQGRALAPLRDIEF